MTPATTSSATPGGLHRPRSVPPKGTRLMFQWAQVGGEEQWRTPAKVSEGDLKEHAGRSERAKAPDSPRAQVGVAEPKARKQSRGNGRNRLVGSNEQLAEISKPVSKHRKTPKRIRAERESTSIAQITAQRDASTSNDQFSWIKVGEARASAGADPPQDSMSSTCSTCSSSSYTSNSSDSSERSDTTMSPPDPEVFTLEARPEPRPKEASVFKGRGPGEYIKGTSWAAWEQTFRNVMKIRRITDPEDLVLMLVIEIGTATYGELRNVIKNVEAQPYEVIMSTLRDMFEDNESAL
ncbi:hypothetical protein L596_000527 [Steinernema carpocapsae]|uniref:Uncharacterized protein n=1 Tax=Steinernema carpocapsae TaxID=34508 RepID=A0A4U8UIG6_STECR|nr:hypothetical protein L596_000527 [Steinernema carpocapsae]